MSSVEAGWHAWLAYQVDTPPNKLTEPFKTVRAYPEPVHHAHPTGTPGAFVTYNTVKPKVSAWEPKVQARV